MNNRVDPIACRNCTQMFRPSYNNSDGFCTEKCRAASRKPRPKPARTTYGSEAIKASLARLKTEAERMDEVPVVTNERIAAAIASALAKMDSGSRIGESFYRFDIHETGTRRLHHAFAYQEPAPGSRAAFTVERRDDGGPWLLYRLYNDGYEKGTLLGKYLG